MLTFEEAYLEIARKEVERISQWFHKTPMLISYSRFEELKRVQQLLHKAICFFVSHYSRYEHLMPMTKEVLEILEICSRYPYRVGTYRPDFVISEDNKIKICEINARFPLNGYFVSGFSELIADNLAEGKKLESRRKEYDGFFAYLHKYFGDFDRVCVLKGQDKPQDIRYYVPIFEKTGICCEVITSDEIDQRTEILENSAVINEYNQMELLTLSKDTIHKLACANILNDLRTVFLIHDKRFLSVLSNPTFLSGFLGDDDTGFLIDHVIPTYIPMQCPNLWENARREREKWVLKHHLLGKSENLYVGEVTSGEIWENIFKTGINDRMVLQPFIKQKKFPAPFGDKKFEEYVVGTLLCFDDCFFGAGIFRASSFVATNQGDDRKIAPLTTDQINKFDNTFVL
jgi:hypothetical protein